MYLVLSLKPGATVPPTPNPNFNPFPPAPHSVAPSSPPSPRHTCEVATVARSPLVAPTASHSELGQASRCLRLRLHQFRRRWVPRLRLHQTRLPRGLSFGERVGAERGGGSPFASASACRSRLCAAAQRLCLRLRHSTTTTAVAPYSLPSLYLSSSLPRPAPTCSGYGLARPARIAMLIGPAQPKNRPIGPCLGRWLGTKPSPARPGRHDVP